MSDARSRTLLDFAIGASVAVVPIMLGMLLLVAVIRPHDTASGLGQADRYVSVRHVAALKTLEPAVVRRQAITPAAPTAAGVLEGLPQCRRERKAQAELIAAQLAALDAVLLRFSTRANTRVETAVGLDAARWFDAAGRALATPFEVPEYPGMRFHVGCADLAAALTALTRSDGRMLDALAWRGTEGAAVVARWHPDQMMAVSAREVARRNPWNGVAGCIYLGARGADGVPTHYLAGARSVQERLCALPAMSGASGAATPKLVALAGEPRPDMPVADDRWQVPPSLQAMLQPLEGLRRPSGALYRMYTDANAGSSEPAAAYRYGPNRIVLDGSSVDVGFSIDLTIDPSLQELAQKTAACYSGRHDVCQYARHASCRRPRAQHRPPPARRRRGAHGGGGRRRCRQRTHRSAGRRLVALRPSGSRWPRSGRGLRQAPSLSGAIPAGRAAESGCLPRCDARVDHQADHGGGIPRRPRGRGTLVVGRARRDEARRRAAARQPAWPADAFRLGALPRPHALLRQRLRSTARGLGTCSRRHGCSAGTSAATQRARTAASRICCSGARWMRPRSPAPCGLSRRP